jgi:hypothetical protein
MKKTPLEQLKQIESYLADVADSLFNETPHIQEALFMLGQIERMLDFLTNDLSELSNGMEEKRMHCLQEEKRSLPIFPMSEIEGRSKHDVQGVHESPEEADRDRNDP